MIFNYLKEHRLATFPKPRTAAKWRFCCKPIGVRYNAWLDPDWKDMPDVCSD